MHRRKPISAKQRKEQLQLKRAIKRGDVPPPASKPDRHRKGRRRTTGLLLAATPNNAADSSRRLESSFVKLPPAFLEKTKALASTLPLSRPIPPELAILSDVDNISGQNTHLTYPKRPKWRYDMSKKEVEANEEGLFRTWLAQTDAAVDSWCNPSDRSHCPAAAVEEVASRESRSNIMPRAPTSYERNLEVWRQLWRVTEISQILLILLDTRCPTLHFPPALSAYLSSVSSASRLRTVLVLTKVDITGPARAEAWTKYLNAKYPHMRIVQVESYVEKHNDKHDYSSARKPMEPHLPTAFRQTLVNALRETHTELLQPPPSIQNDSQKCASWRPRIKSKVDWDAVLKAQGGQVGTAVGGAAAPKPNKPAPEEHAPDEDPEDEDADTEPEALTIGLIGQPNVGKSSLLNALFGTQKVRASRTPGKTKHFQTLFWTSEVRLVDCPGLVIPNYVPMETQVLSGILPISRVSAVPLCIFHAARLLPLERILSLTHPTHLSSPAEDKRTWREGMRPRPSDSGVDAPVWTAMDILTAYANKKGWVTAKAGRPDVNRAGNAILRALAEGKIHWAFWPPGTSPQTIKAHQASGSTDSDPDPGHGIWIAHGHDTQVDIDDDNESTHGRLVDSESEDSDDDDDDDGAGDGLDKESAAGSAATAGRFGALVLDDQSADADDDEESG